jgi:hypothetical protein
MVVFSCPDSRLGLGEVASRTEESHRPKDALGNRAWLGPMGRFLPPAQAMPRTMPASLGRVKRLGAAAFLLARLGGPGV